MISELQRNKKKKLYKEKKEPEIQDKTRKLGSCRRQKVGT